MFWASEASLVITLFRSYDPELGRWLSRDPLRNAEIQEGANLYVYAGNDPVNVVDPLGLQRKKCCEPEYERWSDLTEDYNNYCVVNWPPWLYCGTLAKDKKTSVLDKDCVKRAVEKCNKLKAAKDKALKDLQACLKKPCDKCRDATPRGL